jgi:hypothetical protein
MRRFRGHMPNRKCILGITERDSSGDRERAWASSEEERDADNEHKNEDTQTDRAFRSAPTGTERMPSGATYAARTIVDGVDIVTDVSRKVGVLFRSPRYDLAVAVGHERQRVRELDLPTKVNNLTVRIYATRIPGTR